MTAEATVTNLDDERLIREGEQAVDLYNKDMRNARARIMPMARGLLAAKRKYPATQDFGDWLHTSNYREIEHQDRAALIKIGENDDFAAKFVRTTSLISPQTIWDAVRELMPTYYDSNSTSSSTMAAETAEIVAPEPGKVEPAKPEVRKNEPTIPQHSGRQSPLAKLPNAAWVLSHIVSGDTRSMLGQLVAKRRNRPAWDLLVECIQNGTFGEPTTSVVKAPSLRLLFPWMDGRDRFVRSFDLTKSNDLETIRTVIVPFLLKNPDRSARVTGFLADEVRRVRIEKEETARRQLMHERHQQKLEAIPLPEGQQEIIAFGAPLWPSDRYSYEEIAHACWFVSFIFDLFGDKPPLTKRMNLLHAMKFIEPMLSRGVMVAIGDVADAFVNNPTGAYKWPSKPQRFF